MIAIKIAKGGGAGSFVKYSRFSFFGYLRYWPGQRIRQMNENKGNGNNVSYPPRRAGFGLVQQQQQQRNPEAIELYGGSGGRA